MAKSSPGARAPINPEALNRAIVDITDQVGNVSDCLDAYHALAERLDAIGKALEQAPPVALLAG
jgi:hypothetical protein